MTNMYSILETLQKSIAKYKYYDIINL
jgi:hypothetical protein